MLQHFCIKAQTSIRRVLARCSLCGSLSIYINIQRRALSPDLHRTEWAEVIPSVRHDREDQQDSPREVLDVEDILQPASLEINEVLLV